MLMPLYFLHQVGYVHFTLFSSLYKVMVDYMVAFMFISSHDQSEVHEVQKTRGFECVRGLMADEAVALFQGFYENGNQNAPRPNRPVRLEKSPHLGL
ncbi:hypothetical protein KC19_2G261500 [Ceratodon purpureus]|uniref:Uncharacterized protein n=1 Tax=Ceratodon purpureus TaxID=3225 RepID=A0A8T0IZA1_CERPU|nr:hypothetical protein KC19_2G261500 [Ceratodon purpureus]